MEEPKSVIRETDEDARRLAKGLVRSARFGALAAIDAASGHPLASRVATATDMDGTPVILTSTLSGHTAAVLKDPNCSLLVGEPGKGDPLAHPRVSLFCQASRIERNDPSNERIRRRYLARHPKAELYVDFGDFAFFRLELVGASLNGGFGKAFELNREDLVTGIDDIKRWADAEAGAVDHMNEDHGEAVKLYAEVLCSGDRANWRLACLDPEGLDLVAGDRVERLWFPQVLESSVQIREILVNLAKDARTRSA
ncbi:HugZ family protein [Roseibium sp.]|uniref:HugZ family pyridoxamine 5'-phosphate oxidase n=1 Tax=Roseibium sp. TaxID=1936156 RepID=UPI0039EDEFF2